MSQKTKLARPIFVQNIHLACRLYFRIDDRVIHHHNTRHRHSSTLVWQSKWYQCGVATKWSTNQFGEKGFIIPICQRIKLFAVIWINCCNRNKYTNHHLYRMILLFVRRKLQATYNPRLSSFQTNTLTYLNWLLTALHIMQYPHYCITLPINTHNTHTHTNVVKSGTVIIILLCIPFERLCKISLQQCLCFSSSSSLC